MLVPSAFVAALAGFSVENLYRQTNVEEAQSV